jgi:hypothetical protein
MHFVSTLFAGLFFGTGLILSGMANPTKVQNFLDIFGTWDPSLAFVMGGAILVTAPGFRFVQKHTTPFFTTCSTYQRARTLTHDLSQVPQYLASVGDWVVCVQVRL